MRVNAALLNCPSIPEFYTLLAQAAVLLIYILFSMVVEYVVFGLVYFFLFTNLQNQI